MLRFVLAFLAYFASSMFVNALMRIRYQVVIHFKRSLRDQEEQNLRQLVKSNRIAAAAVSHEVRNLCGALSLLSSNLKDKHALDQDEDFQGLVNLIKGLEKIALLELSSRLHEMLKEVP